MTANQDLIEQLKNESTQARRMGLKTLPDILDEAITALSAQPAPVAAPRDAIASAWDVVARRASEYPENSVPFEQLTKCAKTLHAWLEVTTSPPPQSGDVDDEAKLEELLRAFHEAAWQNGNRGELAPSIYPREEAEALRSFFKRAAKGGEGMVTLQIEDVRKLLGGFGVSSAEMQKHDLTLLYKDHPEAAKRVAEALQSALATKQQ